MKFATHVRRFFALALVTLVLMPLFGQTATAAERVMFTGQFSGHGEHQGVGTVAIVKLDDDNLVVRLGDDFAVDDGPVLWVMLSLNAEGYDDGAVSLGDIKSLAGASEYSVPDDLDV